MNMITRLAAAGALFAGVSVFNSYNDSVAQEEAINKFKLEPAAVSVMDACADSMKRNSVTFKAGANRMSGCACIAKFVADEFDADEFGGVSAVIDLTMRMSKAGDGASGSPLDIQPSLGSKVFDDWTDSRKTTLMRVVGESLGVCGKPDAQL